MPRSSKDQQARNRERIVAAAARLVRERGPAGFSVQEVMGAAGLTHGGFYGHFASRDDLLVQAGASAFAAHAANLTDVDAPDTADDRSARTRFLDAYLSTSHRDHPGVGCPATALAGDVGRVDTPESMRRTYVDGVRNLLDTMQNLSGDQASARVDLATVVGAVLLARATVGDPLSDQFLLDARAHLAGPAD